MRARPVQVDVTCCKCGKEFPVRVTREPDETAPAQREEGEVEETVEVGCWCPWCQTDNLANVPIRLAPKHGVFRALVRSVQGMPGKPEEQE